MNTVILKIKDTKKDIDIIKKGAQLIKSGQVVGFPTETVYGLGANAMDSRAVERIFEAKGRPSDNPLIVHVNHIDSINELTYDIPEQAYALMKKFWPGPLTIIFKKSKAVPALVTAGLDTVAIRVPRHPVARALIEESGIPIAAPSANTSGRPSPILATHVYEDMTGRIPLIIDGGRCEVGLESTVLDMTRNTPVILRPGGVTREMLEDEIGRVYIDEGVLAPLGENDTVKSPGMKYIHYAPRAEVIIVRGELDRLVKTIRYMTNEGVKTGKKIGILATDETKTEYENALVLNMGSRKEPSVIASNLFLMLRDFDQTDVDLILAEGVDLENEGLAVMNRMARAAGFNIIEG